MSDSDYLEELLSEGRQESSGTFTLDTAQALEKMRAHRFASPERYLIHAVAAAHLAGARRIDIHGLTYQATFPELPTGLQAWFWDVGLEPDLSAARLVHNQALDGLPLPAPGAPRAGPGPGWSSVMGCCLGHAIW